MDDDFGYGQSGNSTNADTDNQQTINNDKTNLDTKQIDTSIGGESVDDINSITDTSKQDDVKKEDTKKENTQNTTDDTTLIAGTKIELDDKTYTIDENGNAIDENGNIFKEAKDVNEWLKEYDKVEDNQEINIDTIQNAIGVTITDENDKPIEFENTIDGIKGYVDAVIESAKAENYETAINTLYAKYPILEDVLNYYIANGNSLDGFNEVPDRSNIVVDDNNEAQQEQIIKVAWAEQGRKGDVDSYIQYLKSSGTLAAVAKEELAGLQEADAKYRKQLEEEAEKAEEQRIEQMRQYWNGVHETIKSRKIAGYEIPEQIIITRNGQKLSVTPEDFFNYVYLVDKDGFSAYKRDLMQETFESRRDDELLRAYLKFVGGNYSNLVDMAINKEKVNHLKLKAKERNKSSVRITKPVAETKKGIDIDLGYK